ncbi:peptidase U32 [Methanolobus psychrophilus R15]|nr:peptidase U32 [Methanolobus psychrophilus R15]
MIRKPELLAPAGDRESLIAAVENGADAVYLGIKDFSARAYAGNFTVDEFREGLDYAHLRGVKVFVTLNTLIKDQEIEKAVNLMYTLDELGADAIIVQDIGLLSLARELLPGLPVHASTQMTIHNTEGVRFLQDMGISRIVLAREVSLKEIRTIKKETGMDIETFVHGALCICYSGQCLMSSMIGGRSGNRGHCAQPCRKKYSLMEDKEKLSTRGSFLLSPKDLNTSPILSELIEAGISSFKIEGRMKRPEYVAGVVRIYRRLIDRCISDPQGYFVSDEEAAQLAQLFNREFTTGYFKGNPAGDLMARDRPYNQGVPIGRVIGYNSRGRNLSLELSGPLRTGDGIGFGGGEESGMIVQAMYAGGKPVKEACNRDIVSIPFDAPLRTGTIIYRTLDSSLMKELQSSFEQPGRYRKVPVSLGVQASVGEPFVLTMRDEDDNSVSACSEYTIEAALRKATSMEDIHKQMNKLGNTAFELKAIEINMEDGVFIPIKEMNDTRNKAAAELERIRTEVHRREGQAAYNSISEPHCAENAKKPLLAVSVNNMESLQNAMECGADIIYYDTERYSMEEGTDLRTIASHAADAHVPVYLHTPLIVKDEEMPDVQEQMLTAIEAGFEGMVAANPGVLRKALSLGFRTIADSSFNIFNRQAASVFFRRGAELTVLSPEMNFEQIKDVSAGNQTEYIVHGNLQVMESEHCLVAALTGLEAMRETTKEGSFRLRDEKDFIFPVMTDKNGRTHIFNSKEMCLLEDISYLLDAGVSRFRIDARIAEPSLTGQVVSSYRNAIDSYYGDRQPMNKKCRDISKEFTRGHYHRGIL